MCAIENTDFKATTIVAGTNNINMFFSSTPMYASPENALAPRAVTITRTTPAIKNGRVSLSLMFNRPITTPIMNSTHPSHAPVPGINAKIIASMTPIKKAHAPIKLLFALGIFYLLFLFINIPKIFCKNICFWHDYLSVLGF